LRAVLYFFSHAGGFSFLVLICWDFEIRYRKGGIMFGNNSNGFWDPFAQFSTATLPNGLTLRHASFPVNWMIFRFLIHVGAREDPSELPGINHLLEHLVGDNIPGVSNPRARALFERWGEAPFFGELGYLGTWYGCKVPCQPLILKQALQIFGDMLLNARIENSIDDQKAVITEELHDEGRLRFIRELRGRGYTVQFPGHRMQGYRDETGTMEAVLAATQEDLQGFYGRHYTPANIEVVAAGGLEESALLDLLAQSPLGQFRLGVRNPVLSPLPEIPQPEESLYRTSLSRNQRIVSSGQFENAEVFSRGVIPSWIPYEASKLFCIILEEMLFRVIREQEMSTYGFLADLRFRQEFNFLEIEGRVATDMAGKVQDALSRCIDMVASDASLFEEFREGRLAAVSMYDTSVGDLVEEVVHCLRIMQRIPPLAENLAGYEKLTLGDMQAIAQYLQPERRWTYILEP